MADKLQEVIRYNGSVATRAEAAEGLLSGGVPFAWVIRYLSDSPTLTAVEFQREAKSRDRQRFAARFAERPRDDAPAAPRAHELTVAEFAATLPGRPTRTPAVGVHEWAEAQGRAGDLAWDKGGTDAAGLIGGLLSETPGHGRGRAKALVVKLAAYNALHRDYQVAVSSGAVPQVEAVTPLDPVAFEADAAYVRAMHKRAIYKAIGAGLTVPPHVLAAYPGLTGRAADAAPGSAGA